MGHAGMAATAVRYLRSVGARTTTAPLDVLPRPQLRAVGDDERAPLDRDEFRRVLGNFATGVTVITAPAETPAPAETSATESAPVGTAGPTDPTSPAGPTGPTGPTGPAGFACQSFSSLSLDPPLVSFMVARTSTTWPRIARAGVFCVNILGADQGTLCRAFAVSGGDKFAGVNYDAAPVSGSPRLTGAQAWVDCTIQAVHTGGDHLIVVGRVDALGTAETEGDPLLFHRGKFGRFTP
ncbi:flavin reductase family protein [Streptomyces sp. NPDC005562]|uniref:flavin reductase family protein n=1 Tax=Streptomyces sp. NPDC005562 TaxID=3154890 RepID=UPI00339EAAC5